MVLPGRKGRNLKALLLFFLLCLSFVVEANASTDNDVDVIAKDVEATKKKIEAAEMKQRQVLSALYQINKKIKKIVTDKGAYSQQRAFLEVNIRNLTQKINETEQRTKTQRAMLAERLRAIYKLGGNTLARFVFSSKSSATLETNLKILGIVAARDAELIKNYAKDLEDLEQKRKTLTARLDNLKEVQSKIVAQEKKFLREQEVKGKLLDGIRKSKMFALSKINSLKEKTLQFSMEDSGLFDVLFKPSFADHKGSLPSPLQGMVIQKFGLIKGDDHPYTISHKGVFIAAAAGTPVKSVFEGRVSYVGELPGFGTTVILDHGDHYYSVYSHADNVKVSVGEEVLQHHVIASVGKMAAERNHGIYFEIRHFSEPYDPQQWMKGL